MCHGQYTGEREKDFEEELNNLKKFDKLTKSPKGYFSIQVSRYVNNYKKICNHLKKKDRILDIGSNPPYFLAAIKSMGHKIEGLDINPSLDSELIKEYKLKIKKCDIEQEPFPYKDNSFDKIILSEVFEHLYVNPIYTMKEISRVLKNKGELIFTTPNGYSLKRVGKFILGRGSSANPYSSFSSFIEYGYRGHIREYSLSELKDFLEKTGFIVTENCYTSYEHMFIKKNKLLNLFVRFIYYLLPSLRSHIIIIAEKNE